MDPITQQAVLATAGAAGAGGALYVDDVFSTFLYEGTGASLSINNGIDLAGEGGAVWMKVRSSSGNANHTIVDSARGKDSGSSFKVLFPNLTSSEYSPGSAANTPVSSFNSNGFTAGNNLNTNVSGLDYASWSFRKAPGFFDVVTWSGDSNSGRTIAHNLGSKPGCIMIKRTGGSSDWVVYHQGLGATKNLRLNKTDAAQTGSWAFADTEPTSTHFTVGSDTWVNITGQTYVAYIFAHDDAQFGTNEDESIIKCGSYTGNGSTTGPVINLGFEPQWLIVKRTDSNDASNSAYHSWIIQDDMRGLNAPPSSTASGYANLLFANSNVEEGKRGNGSTAGSQNQFLATSTGFTVETGATEFNYSGGTYIYMAIRRPNKPPTAGTEVFKANTRTGTSAVKEITGVGFPPDLAMFRERDLFGTYGTAIFDRMRGSAPILRASVSGPEFSMAVNYAELKMDGVKIGPDNSAAVMNYSTIRYIDYFFKRASGFFDVVAYEGTGLIRNINHNLTVEPEIMILKNRTAASPWFVYSKYAWENTSGSNRLLRLETSASAPAAGLDIQYLNSTQPTSTVFSVNNWGDINASGQDYIVYLFATLPGISKVGSYAGDTNNNVDVNCGFTSGARFVMIKNITNAGDWYVWDTARGIVSGNDPRLLLNWSLADAANVNEINPLTSGFTINSGSGQGVSETGNTYIFLAIA